MISQKFDKMNLPKTVLKKTIILNRTKKLACAGKCYMSTSFRGVGDNPGNEVDYRSQEGNTRGGRGGSSFFLPSRVLRFPPSP